MYEIATLFFSDSHGLFDEDMLARAQGFERLRAMVLIAAGNENEIDFRIVENLLVIGSAIRCAKTCAITFAADATVRMDSPQTRVRDLLNVGQVRPACQIAGSDEGNP